MLIPLQEAAGFVQTHHAVFEELWRRRDEPFADMDLLRTAAASPHATQAYIVAQLKRMRFVVEADAHAGTWELAPAFVRWLEHLQQISRPVSSPRVQGQLTALDHGLESFRGAEMRGDLATAREILRETRAGFQLLSEDLSQTRAAIAGAVSEAKGEHRQQSAVERFRRINRFWTEYLLPLMELLDPTGALDATCAAWEHQLGGALERKFLPDRGLAERIEGDMRVLRVNVRESFRSCRLELEPLHARLRRESRWAIGAAAIIRRVELHGPNLPDLAASTPLSAFRFAGHIATAALLASAAQWRELSAPIIPIDFGGAGVAADSQAVEDLLAAIEAAPPATFPIEDLLAWLAANHRARGFNALLQVFSLLVTDTRYEATFSLPINEYEVSGGIVRCGRVVLKPRNAA